jgi:hypothetical protein
MNSRENLIENARPEIAKLVPQPLSVNVCDRITRRHSGRLAFDLADFHGKEFINAKSEPNATPLAGRCAGSLYLTTQLQNFPSADKTHAEWCPLTFASASDTVALSLE